MAQINKPSDYFNINLYTGNGGTNAVTGVGFQPDWVWVKDRTSVNSHGTFDIIRGATNDLSTDLTNGTLTNANYLQSFDSDGFTLGSEGVFNTNTNNYVNWNWLADNTTGSSNTDGSTTSTVSANTTSGFSIVTYTGTGSLATVGHGLGSAPKMVIAKNKGSTSNWDCYHIGLSGANYRIQLNSTGAQSISGGSWGSTAPTNSVFTVQDDTATNVSGNTYVAYCFAEKKGFSKFGSYTGNGSTDGTFVYTGFKPAFVMIKSSSSVTQWSIVDSARAPFNQANKVLYPNLSNAEVTSFDFRDYLSNGFKLRTSDSQINASGQTFIYMAFAESPLVGTNNIPATAR
jgi:hypothetical protein